MLISRWSSTAFLRYIEKLVKEFTGGVSKRMLAHETFFHVAGPTITHHHPPQPPPQPQPGVEDIAFGQQILTAWAWHVNDNTKLGQAAFKEPIMTSTEMQDARKSWEETKKAADDVGEDREETSKPPPVDKEGKSKSPPDDTKKTDSDSKTGPTTFNVGNKVIAGSLPQAAVVSAITTAGTKTMYPVVEAQITKYTTEVEEGQLHPISIKPPSKQPPSKPIGPASTPTLPTYF